jgi:hypothetical protein
MPFAARSLKPLITNSAGALLCLHLTAQIGGTQTAASVPSFSVDGVPRIDAVLTLAKRQSIPLGIEYVGPRLFDPVTVRLGSTDVRAVVGALLPTSAGFQLSENNGVLVISHRDVPVDANVLDVRFPALSIPRTSGLEASATLWTKMFWLLHPNAGIVGSTLGDDPVEVGPFELQDVIVRDVLNRIVREHGRMAWATNGGPQVLDPKRRVGPPWLLLDYDNEPSDGFGADLRRLIPQR